MNNEIIDYAMSSFRKMYSQLSPSEKAEEMLVIQNGDARPENKVVLIGLLAQS